MYSARAEPTNYLAIIIKVIFHHSASVTSRPSVPPSCSLCEAPVTLRASTTKYVQKHRLLWQRLNFYSFLLQKIMYIEGIELKNEYIVEYTCVILYPQFWKDPVGRSKVSLSESNRVTKSNVYVCTRNMAASLTSSYKCSRIYEWTATRWAERKTLCACVRETQLSGVAKVQDYYFLIFLWRKLKEFMY